MRRIFAAGMLLVLFLTSIAHGQGTPKPPAGLTVPNVPGYERRVIEGFTLLVHQDVIKNDIAVWTKIVRKIGVKVE